MSDERIRPTIDCGPGRTKQSFKDECDINFIMNKWERTGQIPENQVGKMKPYYGDFADAPSYLEACNQVLAAKDSFASLPAFLRDRFRNEPANLIAFMADPANQEEAIELGLVEGLKTPDNPTGTDPNAELDLGNPIPPNPTPIEGGE